MDSDQLAGIAWVLLFLLLSIGYGIILLRRLLAENRARRPRPQPNRLISLLTDDDGSVTGVKGALYAREPYTGETMILRWGSDDTGTANARSERDTIAPT